MKINKTAIFGVFMTIFCSLSCSKVNTNQEAILIPNGDFENWNLNSLQNWESNSCPLCLPAYESHVIKQEPNAYHGAYAAKFIYNSVYMAWAQNKFSIQHHPSILTSYVKCDLFGADTVSIKIKLFYNGVTVDSGQWLGTSSIAGYTKIDIPITQNFSKADTAVIRIEGGHEFDFANKTTDFWIDYLTLQ
jgi:hypothetical protein